MAIAKCKDCGKVVSTDAHTCPHCGASNPWDRPSYFLVRLIAFLVFSFLLVAWVISHID